MTQNSEPKSRQPIVLKIQGIGNVPSFKNTKMIARTKDGKPFIKTDPEKEAWMQHCATLIEFQLPSLCPITGTGTLTAQQLHSWIAASMPLDDNCKWIESLSVTLQRVPKGREGAVITIEPMTAPHPP